MCMDMFLLNEHKYTKAQLQLPVEVWNFLLYSCEAGVANSLFQTLIM